MVWSQRRGESGESQAKGNGEGGRDSEGEFLRETGNLLIVMCI